MKFLSRACRAFINLILYFSTSSSHIGSQLSPHVVTTLKSPSHDVSYTHFIFLLVVSHTLLTTSSFINSSFINSVIGLFVFHIFLISLE